MLELATTQTKDEAVSDRCSLQRSCCVNEAENASGRTLLSHCSAIAATDASETADQVFVSPPFGPQLNAASPVFQMSMQKITRRNESL